MPEILTPREILAKLVSFPTISRDSNLPLIDWVEEYLGEHGITSYRHLNETGDKAALFAHVGPWEEGAVVLSGHTDVVPVDGQDWSSDPFDLIEKDGKLFGRGSCDMKGFDALAIWALIEAKSRDLQRPLQLALSYDEEVGCIGAPPMIEAMQEKLPKGSAVIVGEPSMMEVVTGHKGGAGFKVHVMGYEVHSSILHEGVNAIMEGAKLINWVNELNSENFAATPGDLAAMFYPPCTTVHVGQIEGGTAHNITAKDCRFGVDFRVVPGEEVDAWSDRLISKAEQLSTEMRRVHPEAGIVLERYFQLPPLAPEENGESEMLVRRLTGDNGDHVVSYGTEAGHFQAAGYSAVVCGPGNIAQAHQPDEFISVAQFDAGESFMQRLLNNLATSG